MGEVAQGKGTQRKMSMLLRGKNYANMQKWVERYEEAKKARNLDQQRFRTLNRGRSFPPNLAPLPVGMSFSWLQEALHQAKANGETMSQREWEFVYGCDFHASSSSFNDTLYLL